jgi:hypothetical protein
MKNDHQRILEGVMTTLDGEGNVNIAPMGPIVDDQMQTLVFRPFITSTTYQNLKAKGEGVFHVTDDALLFARAAVGKVQAPTQKAGCVAGVVLMGACRYYEFKVTQLVDSNQRTTINAQVVKAGRLRDFFGFNRAKHAVLEAAILATRLHLTGQGQVLEQMTPLEVMVQKTGGDPEREAMALLREYVISWQGDKE